MAPRKDDDARAGVRASEAELHRFGTHRNALGALRLLLAALVIVSHVPELNDGNANRELLTMLFGTMTFGDFAVAGFFIISGYLITGSFLSSPDWRRYLLKRVCRIYPAAMVASLLAIVIVAPLAGGEVPWGSGRYWLDAVRRMAMLAPPHVEGSFAGTPGATLNGAMWTISYEFRCYLLVLILGLAGWLHRPRIMLALAAAVIAATVVLEAGPYRIPAQSASSIAIFGIASRSIHLTAIFLAGAAVRSNLWLLRRAEPYYPWLLAPFFLLCFFNATATLAIATLGCVVLLSFAFDRRPALQWIHAINNRNDISYGLYLYGWPVEKLMLWWWPDIGLIVLGLATLAGAAALGAISWWLVEKPALNWAGRRGRLAR